MGLSIPTPRVNICIPPPTVFASSFTLLLAHRHTRPFIFTLNPHQFDSHTNEPLANMEPRNGIIDAYAILGITQDASIKDINVAYKRLALKFHPDKAGSDGKAISRFQSLQDAVEVLRDPSRRSELDRSLCSKGKRPRAWYAPQSGSYYTPNAGTQRPSKRQRDPHDSPYNVPRREGKVFSTEDINDILKGCQDNVHASGGRSTSTRYMYSFGNSVHMDPESEESKASKAKYRAENAQWEQEWAGIDPEVEEARAEVEKARAESRKQAMRDRVARDEKEQVEIDEMEIKKDAPPVDSPANSPDKTPVNPPVNTAKPAVDPFDQAIQNAVNGIQLCAGFWDYARGVAPHPEENIKNGIATALGGFGHYEHARDPKSKLLDNSKPDNNKESSNNSKGATNILPFVDDVSTSNSDISSDSSSESSSVSSSSARSHKASGHSINSTVGGPPHSSSPAELYPCDQDPMPEPLNAHNFAEGLKNNCVGHESSLGSLAPLFEQRLADPLGRYSVDDLALDLNGMILESYASWLEDVRLSIPRASPAPVRSTPEACSHLGGWFKKYGCTQCDTCHSWMPLFLLVCPKCGISGCTRCKFVSDRH
ncbi:unnamed protein product [Penicillium salamii]|uniref:J domain-containing protein n=1 Tax=Penicillium salamii TaxID=1612424 RepID=A0A9W4K1F4_9EURO|nr:unnamed protein product [Penicillium salamii]CAG8101111.1 unnamed protein product [Penicillium salamii]CAG8293347.1 unnamed protein product [Penicillium salamii]CAG8322794.1 unnamed protein product [Penicillium salamii]CAG8418053.1 unnamed protein product [Penicillium salamii]